MAFQGFRRIFPDLAKEVLIIAGTWAVLVVSIAATLYGIFYVVGLTKVDLLQILWASALAASIFAIPYEEYWKLKRFQALFALSACLVIMSFVLLALSELALNFLAFHIDTGLMILGIFATGGISAIFTRNYWSMDMLKSIKSLTAYSLLGEIFLLYLGDYIAGMNNIDPVVRMLFLTVVIVIIAIIGLAIVRLYLSERNT